MDSPLIIKLQILLFVSLIPLFFYLVFRSRNKAKNGKISCSANAARSEAPPEPAGAWPIIGHLHLLAGEDSLLYRALGDMADRCGPVFNIRLGSRRALVVSSWEVAKECFTVNDKALASRPTSVATKHLCYNNVLFGFAPYSPYWREMRKIVILELLSTHRLNMLKHVRFSEIDSGIKEIYGQWAGNGGVRPVVLELDKWLGNLMLNITVRMVAGKRYVGSGDNEAARCLKAINDVLQLLGIFLVSEAIPFLWWLDLLGHEKRMKKTAKEMDLVLGGWLEEHRQRRKSGAVKGEEDEQDFIDRMLSLEEQGHFSHFPHDSDAIIKSTCLAMILGGSDTTAVTLTWAFSLLLNHPHVLKKLQQELDNQIGKERHADESDMKNLVYLQAVVKETMRLYPAAPLLAPREAIEDCTVAGYNVKCGTRLIFNVWKLQRDPTVWDAPSEFRPERFLGPAHGHENVDLRGGQFVLMPFGVGRRSCPGDTFAIQVVHLALARLVHAFDLDKPGNQPIDMTESPGMTLQKAKPLEALLAPRLPSHLYGC